MSDKVSVKVRAIAKGQYGGEVKNPGAVFVYSGKLNAAGGLPMWVEPVDENFQLPAKKAAVASKKVTKKVSKKVAPKKAAESVEEDVDADDLV